MSEQEAATVDPIQAQYETILQSQALWKGRMEKAKRDAAKPITIGAVASVLDGDLYPLLLSTVGLIAQLRDGVAAQMSALEEQIASGGDGTSILPEDAAVLRQVVVDLRELIAVVRSAGSAGVVEAKLVEMEGHATQAEALLDEATLVDEDEEDEGEADGESEDATP